MKTNTYNPSPIEINLAHGLIALQKELENKLSNLTINKMTADLAQDNPSVKIELTDKDGDRHEVILKVVQIPDKI